MLRTMTEQVSVGYKNLSRSRAAKPGVEKGSDLMKRYTLYYTSDRRDPLSNIGEYLHFYRNANSVKTIKGYVSKAKKQNAHDNPRDFFYTDQECDIPLAEENRVYL